MELNAVQATSLYQIGMLLGEGHSEQAILDAIVEAVDLFTDADGIALAVLEHDGGLFVQAGRGLNLAGDSELFATTLSLQAQAIHDRRALLTTDLLAAPTCAVGSQDAIRGARICIALPLICQSEPLGVLSVSFTPSTPVSSEHLEVLRALASQAGATLRYFRDKADELRLRAESAEIAHQFAEQANQLERVQQRLVHREKLLAIGELVHGLAHEMNTPLGIVVSNLTVLTDHVAHLRTVALAAQELVPHLPEDTQTASLTVPLLDALRAADLPYTLDDVLDLLRDLDVATMRIAELVRAMDRFAREDPSDYSGVEVEQILSRSLSQP